MKKLAALAAVLTAAIGLALPASADLSRIAHDCPAVNGQPGYDNNGSGCLDPLWPTRAHGQYGNLAGPDVMLVGDSITTLCKSYLTSRLQAQNLTWGVSYWSGRPTKPAVDWVLSLSVKPKVVIMAIGTNDIYNTTVMGAQIQRLINGLPGVRIMWIDVRAERPAFAVADMRNSRSVNEQIWDNPEITAVRWMSWFDDQPSRVQTYIDRYGVHPIATVGCDFWGAATAPYVIGAAKAAKLKASVPR